MNRRQRERVVPKLVFAANNNFGTLQDLLIYAVKGLSQVAEAGRKVNVSANAVNRFTCEAVFSTLTNVDFDPARFVALINDAVNYRDELKATVQSAGGNVDFGEGPASFTPASNLEGLVAQGETVGIKSDEDINPDILSLKELLIYGLKGIDRKSVV